MLRGQSIDKLWVAEWQGHSSLLTAAGREREWTYAWVGYWVVMGSGLWQWASVWPPEPRSWRTQLGEACAIAITCSLGLRFIRVALERKCFNQPRLPSMSITPTAIYLRHHGIKSLVRRNAHTGTCTSIHRELSFRGTYLIPGAHQYCHNVLCTLAVARLKSSYARGAVFQIWVSSNRGVQSRHRAETLVRW